MKRRDWRAGLYKGLGHGLRVGNVEDPVPFAMPHGIKGVKNQID